MDSRDLRWTGQGLNLRAAEKRRLSSFHGRVGKSGGWVKSHEPLAAVGLTLRQAAVTVSLTLPPTSITKLLRVITCIQRKRNAL